MERIKITELDHIVLNVGDIHRSLKFYIEVLGLQAERLEEFKAGKVGFPSVRINGDTIIDLFPTRVAGDLNQQEQKREGNLNHFCMVVNREDFSGIVDSLAQCEISVRARPVSRWGGCGSATAASFLA